MILGRVINRPDLRGFGKRNISNLFSLNTIMTNQKIKKKKGQ